MLLQSLLLIVTLAVIGSAILTSTLVSAKSAFHSVIMRQGESAMTEATALFVSWAQNNIKQNGIDRLPVWAATPPTFGPTSECAEKFSAPILDASASCKLYRTITWSITGYTDFDSIRDSNGFASEASNLASAQNEHRLSATLNIVISDRTGAIIYSRQSREVTGRLFHGFPYVAVTGERHASSEAGTISSAEGDTAGFSRDMKFKLSTDLAPTTNQPASYTKTNIVTTVDCKNTIHNLSPNAELDDNNVAFFQLRPYGNLAWSYEVPCQSAAPINPNTAPPGYVPPVGNAYATTATVDSTWNKHDDNSSSFAH